MRRYQREEHETDEPGLSLNLQMHQEDLTARKARVEEENGEVDDMELYQKVIDEDGPYEDGDGTDKDDTDGYGADEDGADGDDMNFNQAFYNRTN